jgi:pimeloyl-ACP methyl ester carboxylesterase
VASLRFDLRGHGESDGTALDATPAGVLHDIGAASRTAVEAFAGLPLHFIATSFGGGLTAYAVAQGDHSASTVTLINPLIDYRRRFLFEKPWWRDGALTEGAEEVLATRGWLDHGGVLRLTRAFLTELEWIRPDCVGPSLTVPTLTIHGTKDTTVPHDLAYLWSRRLPDSRFVSVDGADHGLTVPGDLDYSDPQTNRWQEHAFDLTTAWILDKH